MVVVVVGAAVVGGAVVVGGEVVVVVVVDEVGGRVEVVVATVVVVAGAELDAGVPVPSGLQAASIATATAIVEKERVQRMSLRLSIPARPAPRRTALRGG